MNSNANFKVLGLSSDASWDEVKSAFRRLARLYHPDVAGPDGARKFAEITEAYMILKESISPSPGASRSAVRRETVRRPERRERVVKREPLIQVFWKRLVAFFSFAKTEKRVNEASDSEIPPVRVRFIGSVISRAESEMYELLSKRDEVMERTRTEAFARRLRSRHPGVVLLALKRLPAKGANEEILRIVIDHFAKNTPTTEVLEHLLALFSASSLSTEFAGLLCANARRYTAQDALLIIKWIKHRRLSAEFYAPFLSHESNSVIAATLSAWPLNHKLPDSSEVFNLLKKEDEFILIPLLRMLKKEKMPIWAASLVLKIAAEHKSPAARVWASAIVREQKLG